MTTKIILFDADNTLRRCTVEGQPCPNKPGEWELLPDVKERFAEVDWNVVAAGIVSNQGGIALGRLTEDVARTMLVDTLVAAVGSWCPFWPVMLCPHAPIDPPGCECRKPKPKLILDAIHAVQRAGLKLVQHERRGHMADPVDGTGLPWPEVLFVGDQLDDQAAADAAGVKFAWAENFFCWSAPEDPGIAWEGTIRAYASTIRARLFGGHRPRAMIWSEGGWRPATSRVTPVILCAARAGGSFWKKSAAELPGAS